jgi:hypothetical protein
MVPNGGDLEIDATQGNAPCNALQVVCKSVGRYGQPVP